MGEKRRRVLKLVVFFVAGCLVAALVAGAILAKPFLRQHVIDEAARRGVVLEPGEVHVAFGHVSVDRSSFRLIGVPGVSGTAESTEVFLDFLTPKRVETRGVSVEAVGSAPMLALAVTEWTKRFPEAYRLPTQAQEVNVSWRPAAGQDPWLTLKGGSLTPTTGGATFHADAAKALGFDVGKVGAAFTANDADVALGFGEDDVGNAPVRIRVQHALPSPTADVELAPVDLDKLAGPFGVKLPIKDVVASGKAHLVFERAVEPKPISGHLLAKLQGFVPPHPPELDGFVFGDSTTLESDFTVTPDRKNVTLTKTTVAAGAFKLAGNGSIEREDTHARIRMALTGNLPCDALAGAAAETHLGSVLGKIVGAAAKQALKGSVGVTVKLDADTRELENAKLERIIGVGCGLKPLDFTKLDFGALQKSLPPLPSGLPPLPNIDLKVEKKAAPANSSGQ